MSKRRDEYLKTFQPEEQEGQDIEDGEESSQREAASDGKVSGGGDGSNNQDSAAADAGVTTVGRTGPAGDGRRASTAPAGGKGSPREKEERVAAAVPAEAGLSRQPQRDLVNEQLEKEAAEIFNEMKECMVFHDLY